MFSTAVRTPPPRPAHRDWLELDSYLTDGLRLFRVVSHVADAHDEFAGLEDCMTLRVRTYTPGQLAAMRLRPVSPGG